MIVQNSLFLGSRRARGLFLPNIESGILTRGKVTGALKQKCIDVAPRSVHLMRKQDGLVLHRPLSPAFRGYIEDLYGFTPSVFVPANINLSPDVPLSLVDALLGDPTTLHEISIESNSHGWTLAPFMPHTNVFKLARALHMEVEGMEERHVKQGKAERLNDKVEFQRVCRELDIPIPSSAIVNGWDALVKEAHKLFKERGSVMLRQSRTNGGLGVVKIMTDHLREHGHRQFIDELESRLVPREPWIEQPVLVEPVLNLRSSPSTLLLVEKDGSGEGHARLISHVIQMFNGNTFIGCRNPSGLPDAILDRLITYTHRYAEHAIELGATGYLGIDWGLLDGGEIVAFESNLRFGGQNHVLAIARRLCGDRVNGIRLESCDALHVDPSLRLESILLALRRENMLWDARRGDGIVISIPPANGSMGYVAIAETSTRLHALVTRMNEDAQNLC